MRCTHNCTWAEISRDPFGLQDVCIQRSAKKEHLRLELRGDFGPRGPKPFSSSGILLCAGESSGSHQQFRLSLSSVLQKFRAVLNCPPLSRASSLSSSRILILSSKRTRSSSLPLHCTFDRNGRGVTKTGFPSSCRITRARKQFLLAAAETTAARERLLTT
jgi:hypothetical protein